MSSQVEDRVESVEAFEDEFAEQCGYRVLVTDSMTDCNAKADWVSVKPCCGSLSYTCNAHIAETDAAPDSTFTVCLRCRARVQTNQMFRNRIRI